MNRAQPAHRQRVLRALGVMPYGLRTRQPPDAAEPVTAHDARLSDDATCVLVLPEACSTRQLALLDAIMRALGGVFVRSARVHATAGELDKTTPHAGAYLAFGEGQARALGRSLPAAVTAQAEILLLDTPEALFQPAGKRRLWQAIGGLRRHWRAAASGGS